MNFDFLGGALEIGGSAVLIQIDKKIYCLILESGKVRIKILCRISRELKNWEA